MRLCSYLRASVIVKFFIIISLIMGFPRRVECDLSQSKPGRLSPSQQLPVLGLMEPVGEVYDPRPEDIDAAYLRMKLGNEYDPQIMKETEPRGANSNGTILLNLRKNRGGHMVPEGPPPKYIQRLQLKHIRLGAGKKIPLTIGNKMKRKFKDLLWLQSYCPLSQKWKDLGLRFWPRWILENSCASRTTCSFPRGMTCRPHKSEEKILLRWHCQNWETQENCDWIKVRYPIVKECTCRC